MVAILMLFFFSLVMVGVNGVFRTRLIGVLHIAPSVENKQEKNKELCGIITSVLSSPLVVCGACSVPVIHLLFFLGRAIQHFKKKKKKKRKKSTFFVVYGRLSIFAEADLCPVVRNKT